jgi:signal transduction histidine kinase
MANRDSKNEPRAARTPAFYRFGPDVGAVLAFFAFLLLWFESRPKLGLVPATALFVCGALGLVLAISLPIAANRFVRKQARALREALSGRLLMLEGQLGAAERSMRESEATTNAVAGWLVLLDPSYSILRSYPLDADFPFAVGAASNRNFLDRLQELLPAETCAAARDFLGQLFDATRSERDVLASNPLAYAELKAIDRLDETEGTFLSFGFRRIFEDASLTRVLVSIYDVSYWATRERALLEAERHKAKQFEILLGLVHVPPSELDTFVLQAKDRLGIMDATLEASGFAAPAANGPTALLQQRLDVVLLHVHAIVEGASFAQLPLFERTAAAFEEQVAGLRARSELGGADYVAVVSGLAAVRAELDELQALRLKMAVSQRAARPADEADELVSGVDELASTLAKRLGKTVMVDADGFDSRALSPDRRLVVKDVLVALTRNSVTHGIESPAEREAAHKSRVATIEIRPLADAPPDSFGFTFRDDGRGLDPERIRIRAIEAGLLPAGTANNVDDSEVAGLIFVPGFSTAVRGPGEAGRGMGMNVVKQRVVDDCGGEITIDSEPGNFCEFSFVLPDPPAEPEPPPLEPNLTP